jgi:hypothetical protein
LGYLAVLEGVLSDAQNAAQAASDLEAGDLAEGLAPA